MISIGSSRVGSRLRTAILMAAVTLAAVPSVALAHIRLLASNPAADSHVAAAPRELRLTFSEKAELRVSRVRLLGPDGKAVTLAALTSADSGRTVVAAVSAPVAPGTYTVEWQIAGRDGHPMRGRFSFHVGDGAPAPSAGPSNAPNSSTQTGHAGHSAPSAAAATPAPAKTTQAAPGGRPPRPGLLR